MLSHVRPQCGDAIEFVISWQSKPRFKNTSKAFDPFAGVDIISPSPPVEYQRPSSYNLCVVCTRIQSALSLPLVEEL